MGAVVTALGTVVSTDGTSLSTELASQRIHDHPYRQHFWLDGDNERGQVWHHKLWCVGTVMFIRYAQCAFFGCRFLLTWAVACVMYVVSALVP